MKYCWVCGKELEIIKDQPYHYKESGLDNVYLHGIIQYKCSGCGEEAAAIPNIEELHLLIVRSIIYNNEHLSTQEVVFLKKELGPSFPVKNYDQKFQYFLENKHPLNENIFNKSFLFKCSWQIL